MSVTTTADLASSLLLRGHASRLRADLDQLTERLSTGQVTAAETAIHGSYRTVSGIEQTLSRLGAYAQAGKEAATFAAAVQSALGSVQDIVVGSAPELLAAGSSTNPLQLSALGKGGAQDFDLVVSRLNLRVGDRALFAGAATDGPALADAGAMLSALEAAVASEVTASGVVAAVDQWFAPGQGFDTMGYAGSAQRLSPLTIGPGQSAGVDVTAADEEIRQVLKGLALAALVDRGPLAGSTAQSAALAQAAGEVLSGANAPLLDTMARVGTAEEAIETALARNASDTAATKTALAGILNADPYETATRLQEVESQLQVLYELTARASRLKLTDYL